MNMPISLLELSEKDAILLFLDNFGWSYIHYFSVEAENH